MLEPEALAAYEANSGNVVQHTGFLSHDGLMIGCSLDGHVGDFDGLVEVKAPRPANHWKYLKSGGLPSEHRIQSIHNLFVTGARYAHFCSFAPDFPPSLRLFRVHVERNQAEVDSYALLLQQFLREVEAEYAEIERMAGVVVA